MSLNDSAKTELPGGLSAQTITKESKQRTHS